MATAKKAASTTTKNTAAEKKMLDWYGVVNFETDCPVFLGQASTLQSMLMTEEFHEAHENDQLAGEEIYVWAITADAHETPTHFTRIRVKPAGYTLITND